MPSTDRLPSAAISDRDAQYLIAVGDLLYSAELAKLDVEVQTRGGTHVTGVPVAVGRADAGLGRLHAFRIGDTILRLDQLVHCGIGAHPDGALARPRH